MHYKKVLLHVHLQILFVQTSGKLQRNETEVKIQWESVLPPISPNIQPTTYITIHHI